MTLFWGCSCNTSKPTSDPLAGWQKVYNSGPDPAVVKDYQDYIQQLPPIGPKGDYVGPVFFYENKAGQHAVTFEYDKPNKDVWVYYLFYEKNNRRINVEMTYRGRYWNP